MRNTVIGIIVALIFIFDPLVSSAGKIDMCNSLLNNGKNKEAEQCYYSTLEESGFKNESLLGLSYALYNLKKYEEALDKLDQIDESEYKNIRIVFLKSMLYKEVGKPDIAIEYFDEFISSGPEKISVEAYRYRGLTRLEMVMQAQIVISAMSAVNGKDIPYPFSISEIEDANLKKELTSILVKAEEDISFYMGSISRKINMCFEHGLVEYLFGNYSESMDKFEECVAIEQKQGQVQISNFWIGINLQEMNKHEHAIPYFTRAIELDPTHASSYYHRSLSYIELNNVPAATSDLETAIEIFDSKRYRETLQKIQPKQ